MTNEETATIKDAINILDNVTYWETCPELYKASIPLLIERLKKLKK